MKVLDMTFVQGFIRMADDGFRLSWHERNGGNLSYRIKPEEVKMIKNRLKRRRIEIFIIMMYNKKPKERQIGD